MAGSCLTGEERALDDVEFAVLLWPDADDAPPDVVDRLAREGLLLTDSDDPVLQELRRREERLSALHWPHRTADYHFLTRRESAALGIASDDLEGAPSPEAAASMLVAAEGIPPPAFHRIEADQRVELPICERRTGLFRTLLERRTTRAFDTERPLPLERFSTVLRYVFGAHGYERAGELVALSKTSPSGGGLHPIEAYPVVLRVEGVSPGLYHYDVASHELALIGPLARDEGEHVVDDFTAGQFWFRDAHALIVLAARFERTFWKYKVDDRAYSVLLMDAGHLSQSFYLVCTDLGLGAFVTAFVNDVTIGDRLGLEREAEGALAVLGLGIPGKQRSVLDPEIVPYVPRTTSI
jgi:putative peptide maturation dehydrogenase